MRSSRVCSILTSFLVKNRSTTYSMALKIVMNGYLYEHQTRQMGKSEQKYGPDTKPLWDNFAVWLKTGQGIYWINGKAGSGKSTLMNYICQHDLKRGFLRGWCVDGQLLTPTYFFWAAGSRQQKSIDGLLRSLIYQMLTQCRELLACLNVSYL